MNMRRGQQGSALLGVLILLSLALIITAGMLDSAATNSKTRALVNTQSNYYYDVEETMNRTVAWLQANSKYLVTAFSAANFNNNFFVDAVPTMGANEGEHFGVPTLVKMASDHQKSVMLSNNTFFGEPAFPASTHLDTGAAFNAVQSFANADLGPANARVLLVWARETEGHYEPIFRVDVVTGNNPDRGVHSYSYIYSHLVTTGGVGGFTGFYGRDLLRLNTGNNDCYSYLYTFAGAWNRGAPRSNCVVGSDGPIEISSDVYGSAKTLQADGVSLMPPGGSVSGNICEGAGCHNMSLPTYGNWSSYCPAADAPAFDRDITDNATLEAGGCYRDIHIDNRKTLTLTDTENPYYIRFLDFRANFAVFTPGNVPQGKRVTIFVERISNDHINGNQFYNLTSAPHQLLINYIGTTELQLNGTAAINAFIIAPQVRVYTNGNFIYYGGIMAKQVEFNGNARPNADEKGIEIVAPPVLSDLTFSLKKASQRYR